MAIRQPSQDWKGLGSPLALLGKVPSSEEEILALVESVWSYVREHRRGLEYRIKEATHFLAGDQWIRYLAIQNRFANAATEDWIPKPVTNFLVKHFDHILDLYTSGQLMPRLSPATQDQGDIEAAQAAQRVLHSEYWRLKTHTKTYIPAAAMLLVTGNVFLSAGWDPRSKEKTRVAQLQTLNTPRTLTVSTCPECAFQGPRDQLIQTCPVCQAATEETQVHDLDEYGTPIYDTRQEPVLGEDGKPSYEEISLGQIEETVISPLNFFPLPCRTLDNCRGAMEAEPIDLDTVGEWFGSKAQSLVAEDLNVEQALLPTWQGGSITDLAPDDRDQILLKIFRYEPGRKFKNGCLAIVAGGQLMYKGDLDSCDGTLSPGVYTHIKYRELPGLFWGGSLFTDLIAIQKRANAIDSHVIANRKQMVSNQWLIPEGAGISQVDGRSGLVIRWNPHATGGFQPQRLPGVPVPAQVIQERESALRDMEMISGAQEIELSRADSGQAVQYLLEQATKRFGPQIALWRAGLAEHEKRKLILAHKYWTEVRTVQVLGDNQDTQSYFYRGADFYGAQDMRVEMGIGLEFSSTAQRQQLLQLFQQGVLGDPRSPEVRGKLLEQLNVQGFETEYVLDAKKARRVILDILAGKEPPPLMPEIDNHGIQYTIMREYILTAEFERQPIVVQQALLQRAQLHHQALQQAQQQAMMAAQAAKGTSPEISGMVARSGAGGMEELATQTQGA